MADQGIKEFCQIALAREFTTPDRVREVISDAVRAQKSGKEVPVGEIFRNKGYLDRDQVLEIMKELYGGAAFGSARPEGPIADDADDADDLGEAPVAVAVASPAAPPVPDRLPEAAPAPAPIVGRERAAARRPDPGRLGLVAAIGGAVFAAVVLGQVVGGLFAAEPPPTLPGGSPAIALAASLDGRLRVEESQWFDADGRGRPVLLVHYVVPAGVESGGGPPERLIARGLSDGAIVETLVVPVEMNYETVRALSETFGKDRLLEGGLLRRKPSGILVLPFDYPFLIDAVLLGPS